MSFIYAIKNNMYLTNRSRIRKNCCVA